MDAEKIAAAAESAADENGMVEVEAIMEGVKDNGKWFAAGDKFHMHKDLVPAHVQTGQVKIDGDVALAGASDGRDRKKQQKKKQQTPPRDKQITSSQTK